MGYCISMCGCDFRIAAEEKRRALELWRAYCGSGSADADRSGVAVVGGASVRQFAWTDPDSLDRATTIEEVLDEFRYEPELDPDAAEAEDPAIVGLEFTGEKIGDEVRLFAAIAPTVTAGSHIDMIGEDGARWRWWFDGTTMQEQEGLVVYR